VDRQLASAVIATFRDDGVTGHSPRLQRFSMRRWTRNFHWLDASGLALYFLERVRELEMENALPQAIVRQLEQRRDDNQGRTAALFDEFLRLNAEFGRVGISYVNLKGFTLVPDYCAALSLRYQMDCDFLIDVRDATRCSDVLQGLGYSLIAKKRDVLEFKTAAGSTPSIRELYKARPQRSVEVHLCDKSASEFHPSLLERAVTCSRQGYAFPALCAEDLFLAQASHLLRHLRSEWTRASWVLEFRNFVLRHHDDGGFWDALRRRASEQHDSALAVGVAVQVAEEAFGDCAPAELKSWSGNCVPKSVGLWVKRYGDEALLTDFPGSKLYLLLERAIRGDDRSALVRNRLFPHRAPPPFAAPPRGNLLARLSSAGTRWSYFLFRLKFHIKAGLRYFIESFRWNRLMHNSASSDKSYPADYAANAAD
jgi:hypothetical protein